MDGKRRARGPNLHRVRELLDYNPETGLFTWKVDRGSRRLKGCPAGTTDSKGYIQIKLDDRLYLAHRLAWLVTYGVWVESDIDHADRDRSNNRVNNLRLCSVSENQQNRGAQINNTSGFPGVSYKTATGKWQSYITVNGRRHHLGSHAEKVDAIQARQAAQAQMHPFSNTT